MTKKEMREFDDGLCCVVRSVEECVKIYSLNECEYRIILVEEV